jgi:hypothetical protein
MVIHAEHPPPRPSPRTRFCFLPPHAHLTTQGSPSAPRTPSDPSNPSLAPEAGRFRRRLISRDSSPAACQGARVGSVGIRIKDAAFGFFEFWWFGWKGFFSKVDVLRPSDPPHVPVHVEYILRFN